MAVHFSPKGLVPTPGPSLSDFAREFLKARKATGVSRREIANHCGVPESSIESWELGESIPRPLTWKRLCGMWGMRGLRHHKPVCGDGKTPTIGDGEFVKLQAELLAEPEPKPEPPPVVLKFTPAPLPPPKPVEPGAPPLTFGAGLKKYREANRMSTTALGTLIDTHPTAITKWERGNNLPIKAHYDTIIQLLPELAAAMDRGEVMRPLVHSDRRAVGRAIQAKRTVRRERTNAIAARVATSIKAAQPVAQIKEVPPPAPVAVVKPKAKAKQAAPATFGQLAEQYARARADVIVKRKLVVSARQAWADAETACKEAEATERAALKALDASA